MSELPWHKVREVAAPVIPKRLRRVDSVDEMSDGLGRSTRDSKEIEADVGSYYELMLTLSQHP